MVLTKRSLMEETTHWQRFGVWYQSERKARKITQQEAADRAGIRRPHLSAVENGLTGVKRDTVKRLAAAIGVDEDEALKRAGFAPTMEVFRIKKGQPPMELDGTFIMDEDKLARIDDLFSEFSERLNYIVKKKNVPKDEETEE